MTNNAVQISQISMQLEISSEAIHVWKALTENIGLWWPAEFYAGGQTGERDFSLEAWPGGRMLETWDDGGGVLWGTVVGIEPKSMLQICGNTFPGWGGPAQWYGTWELSAAGAHTIMKFSESAIGEITATGVNDKEKGWQFLWRTLQAYLERTPLPVWED